MSYKFITKYDSPNFGYGESFQKHGGNDPKEIIIHYWDDPKRKPSIEGVVNTLCNPNRQASAHDVVQDGVCYHLVRYGDPAWHAGDYYVNTHSIGIECSPYLTDGDFRTVAEVIANIWKTYGKLPLRGHKDVVSTSCPGEWYPRLNELYKLAEKYYDGSTESKPKPSKPQKPSASTKYKVGDVVNINGVYTSSSSSSRLRPAKSSGKITRIVSKAANPYLLDNGDLGWVNDKCITGKKGNSSTSNKKSVDQVAKEIINKPNYGGWGTGQARINKLTSYGGSSFAIAVQKRINELL